MTPDQTKHIWRLLSQTYGHKFAEQYGPTPNEAWSSLLSRLTPDQASHALHALIRTGSGFAPTLPEFVVAAKSYREPCTVTDISSRVEKQRTDPEVARRNIQMLRDTLRDVFVWKPGDPR